MKRLNTRAWLAAGAIAATTAAVFAHGGATGIVGERMMGMMMLSEQVKALTPALSSGNANPATLKEAAGMIKMHAGSAMTDLFPEGSLEAPSEARPEIWTRWPEFTDYAEKLAALALELEQSTSVAASPARATLVEGNPAPVRSEWEALDFATLMGLPKTQGHAGHQMGIDPTVVGSITEEQQPPTRPPAQIFADITATCSSCHAAFRR